VSGAGTAFGWIASSTPSVRVTVAVVAVISLLTPRVEPGRSSSSRSGQRNPPVRTPRAMPAGAGDPADDHHPGVADQRLELEAGPVRRDEEERVGQEVVEAATTGADDRDVRRLMALRGAERELEIGRVLVRRVLLDHRAFVARPLERLGTHRVEVTDHQVGAAAERVDVLEPGVGRDDVRIPGERVVPTRIDGVAAGEHQDVHRRSRHSWACRRREGSEGSLRRHDPDQVLTVGGCVPTLSARRTGLPRVAKRP
jgi:hypothetical protein